MVERERIGKRRTVVDGSCAGTSVCSESDIEVELILFIAGTIRWILQFDRVVAYRDFDFRNWKRIDQTRKKCDFLTNQNWASNFGFVKNLVEKIISQN